MVKRKLLTTSLLDFPFFLCQFHGRCFINFTLKVCLPTALSRLTEEPASSVKALIGEDKDVSDLLCCPSLETGWKKQSKITKSNVFRITWFGINSTLSCYLILGKLLYFSKHKAWHIVNNNFSQFLSLGCCNKIGQKGSLKTKIIYF